MSAGAVGDGESVARDTGSGSLREQLVEALRTSDAGALRSLDLRGADLSELDLADAELAGLDLSDADLTRCNLTGANLAGATLTGAALFEARLSGAQLVGADLTRAQLGHCEAVRAGLGGATLDEARLFEADLSGASLSQASLRGADLRCTKLTGAWIHDADLTDVDASRCELDEARLDRSRVDGATFDFADLRRASLAGLSGYDTASWLGVDDRESDYRGAYALRRLIVDENYLHEFRNAGRWHAILYWLWRVTSDCGRSFSRWALWTVLVVLLFAGLYGFVDIDYGDHPTFLSPIYFSVVTLTTLGYGDVLPASVAAQVVVMAEVILGYIALGGLISILANKMARRGE